MTSFVYDFKDIAQRMKGELKPQTETMLDEITIEDISPITFTCLACNGSGQNKRNTTCVYCGGTGIVT